MNVQLTIVRGGRIEFARTGIYPEYLQFFFPDNQKHWRVKLHHEVQSGFLRSNGEIHYEYHYINGECKIRAWNKDYLTSPDFEQIDYVMAMLVD
jgi:hypothetical protein